MGLCLSKEATEAVIATDSQATTVKAIENNNNNAANNSGNKLLSNKYLNLLSSLNRIPIIASLNDELKYELSQSLIEKIFESGEFLMRQGEAGNEFFLIIKGSCDVFIGNDKIATLNDNDYCGEQALLNAKCQRTASVVANTKTYVYVMKRETFNKIIRNTNEMKNLYLYQRKNERHNVISESNNSIDSENSDSQNSDLNTNDEMVENNEPKMDENMNEDTVSWLVKSVKNNLLFSDLSNNDVYNICKHMRYQKVDQNQTIIKQNSKNKSDNDKFYVIFDGTFSIEKDGKMFEKKIIVNNGNVLENDGKNKNKNDTNICVGELALIFNMPRSATIQCISENGGIVWYLTRTQYKHFNKKIRRNIDSEKVEFLRKIPIFQSLYNSEIQLMARAMTREEIPKNTVLFKQGDIGNKFYLIMKGTVLGKQYSKTKISSKDDSSKYLQKEFELSQYEYFGELSIKYDKPRSATIIAKTDLTLLSVETKDFNILFGSLDSLMERQIEEYQKPKQSKKEYRINLFKRNLNDFIFGPYVGRGKYGCVQFVKDKNNSSNNNNTNGTNNAGTNNNNNNTVYALKKINKKWVHSHKPKQSKRRINALFNERDIMREFSNDLYNNNTKNKFNFLVTLFSTFKDDTNIYFLMSGCVGGDFFNILKTRGYVSEHIAQFYIACIIEGINVLHSYNMIHRDLKPENIVLNKNGYAMITDFGFTKKLTSNDTHGHSDMKTYTLCGTPGYMAPEVILGHGYSYGCDWFSIGCVLYDMVTGAPPFPTKTDQFTMVKTIMSNKLHLPMYLSFWIKDLIVQFLKIKPVKRLGIIKGGIKQIRKHHFFTDFDWNALHKQTLKAPIIPNLSYDMDPSNFDTSIISDDMVNDSKNDRNVPPLHPSLNNWDIAF